MDWKKAGKATAILLSIFGISTSGILYLVGQWNITVLSLYASAALVLVPILYLAASQKENRVTISSSLLRILLIVFSISFVAAMLLSTNRPRPSAFFVVMSVLFTIATVIALGTEQQGTAVSLTALSVALFHYSTTVPPALWLGEGDGSVVWVGIRNSLIADTVLTTGNYQWFASWFSGAALTTRILGVSVADGIPIYGILFSIGTVWATFLVSRQVDFISRRDSAVPATLLPFTFVFFRTALYSIPSTSFAMFSVFVITMLIYDLKGELSLTTRWIIVFGTLLLFALFLHKIAHIWLLSVIVFFVIVYSHVSSSRPLSNYRGLRVLGIYVLSFAYVATVTGQFLPLINRLEVLFTVTSVSTSSAGSLLSKPWALLGTFVSSTTVLALLLTGLILATIKFFTRQRSPFIAAFVATSTIFAAVYFPGPAYLFESLTSALNLYRVSRYGIVFVVIVGGYGLMRSWNHSQRAAVAITILLCVSGGFAAGNDIYSRDNGFTTTSTSSNYLTEIEQTGLNWAAEIDKPIAVSVHLRSYYRGLSRGPMWNQELLLRDYSTDPEQLFCDSWTVGSVGEIERRGSTTLNGSRYEQLTRLGNQRHSVYNNGDILVYTECV